MSDRWWWILGALLVGASVYVISTLYAKHKVATGRKQRGARIPWLASQLGGHVRTPHPPNQPSFGAPPRSIPTDPGEPDQRGVFDHAIELHRRATSVLVLEYVYREFVNRFGQQMRAEHHDSRVNRKYSRPGSRADRVKPEVRHMVQVRISPTPTLCLIGSVPVPQTYTTPVRYTPINEFSTAESLGDCPSRDQTFDQLFRVLCGDPQFASTVLTPDVVALMVNSPWYHQRMLVLEDGVLWTQQVGALPDPHQLQYDIDHLVQFAATIPTGAWQYRAPTHGTRPQD